MADRWEEKCSHLFTADVTDDMKRWLRLFGAVDSEDRSYYFDIIEEGGMQLCDTTDGGSSILFCLPDLNYCPVCGNRFSRQSEGG